MQTCYECYNETVATYNRMRALFLHDGPYSARRHALFAAFDRARPVLVMAVNLGQAPFLLNWQCSLRAHGLDEAGLFANMVVFATDAGAWELVTSHGIPALKPPAHGWPKMGWKGKTDGISDHYHPGPSSCERSPRTQHTLRSRPLDPLNNNRAAFF